MRIILLLFVLVFTFGFAYAEEAPTLKTGKDRLSYSLGLNIGVGLRSQDIDIDTDLLVRGMLDAYQGKEALLAPEEVKKTLTDFQEQLKKKAEEEANKELVEAKAAADEFMAQNSKKSGVVSLESGLQYKVLQQGSGPKPTEDDQVTIHLIGKLADGTEFDSTYKRGEPRTTSLDRLIPGLAEALKQMPVGSEWQIYVPPSLGYGALGTRSLIGPNVVLIFDVELLSIQKSGAQ